MMKKFLASAVVSAFLPWIGSAQFLDLRAESSLVSDASSVAPGASITVGLRLQMPENAYVYWRNPGDAGLPVTMDWILPDGVTAGEMEWPAPGIFDEPPLRSFGYKDEVILPVPIRFSDAWESGNQESVPLRVRAEWLVCREGCVPGSADLTIELPVSDRVLPDRRGAKSIARFREKVPMVRDGWKGHFRIGEQTISVRITAPDKEAPQPDTPFFLPYREGLVEPTADQPVRKTGQGWDVDLARDVMRQEPGSEMKGILRFRSGGSVKDPFLYEITLVRED